MATRKEGRLPSGWILSSKKIGSKGRIKCDTVKGGDSNTAPADSAGSKVCWIISDKPNVEQKQKLKKSCKRIFKEYIFAKLFQTNTRNSDRIKIAFRSLETTRIKLGVLVSVYIYSRIVPEI